MRRWKTLFCLCLTLIFVLTTVPVLPTEAAVTRADIDALEDEADEIATRKKALKEEVEALKADKETALAKKNKLDEQSDLIREEIRNTEAQIDKYEQLLAQTRQELEDAQEKEAQQYVLFCQRVRAMEENGTVDYWAVLFGASDFSDMLSRLADIQEVMEYDQGVMDTLAELRRQIETKQSSLQEQMAAEEAAKTKLEAQKAELDAQVKEAAAMLVEIEEEQEGAQVLYEAELKAAEEIAQQIKKLEKELELQNTPATKGGYIWPTDSRYITSPFGTRLHPIYKVYRTHAGVDIGRVGYTSSVYAVKAGTVITSQYSNSYGHYVVISHGSGNTSLYAHLTSRKVKVGDTVKQGQVVGITGSTGASTGPHLHFELREGGSLVDPLTYLTGYTKGWS